MIFLIIFGIILFVIIAVLFLPVKVLVDFEEKFLIKVFFFKIKVYEYKSDSNNQKQKKSENKASDKKISDGNKKSLFAKAKERFGFCGAVKEFFSFFKEVFSHTKSFLRHIKFERVKMFINIATDDSAKTAIEYGTICSFAYPVLSAFESACNIKYKKIDINADFETKTSEYNFSFFVKLRIFFLLITLLKIYKDYKKFTVRIETDERK